MQEHLCTFKEQSHGHRALCLLKLASTVISSWDVMRSSLVLSSLQSFHVQPLSLQINLPSTSMSVGGGRWLFKSSRDPQGSCSSKILVVGGPYTWTPCSDNPYGAYRDRERGSGIRGPTFEQIMEMMVGGDKGLKKNTIDFLTVLA